MLINSKNPLFSILLNVYKTYKLLLKNDKIKKQIL